MAYLDSLEIVNSTRMRFADIRSIFRFRKSFYEAQEKRKTNERRGLGWFGKGAS